MAEMPECSMESGVMTESSTRKRTRRLVKKASSPGGAAEQSGRSVSFGSTNAHNILDRETSGFALTTSFPQVRLTRYWINSMSSSCSQKPVQTDNVYESRSAFIRFYFFFNSSYRDGVG
jgi:hypothetical protein